MLFLSSMFQIKLSNPGRNMYIWKKILYILCRDIIAIFCVMLYSTYSTNTCTTELVSCITSEKYVINKKDAVAVSKLSRFLEAF